MKVHYSENDGTKGGYDLWENGIVTYARGMSRIKKVNKTQADKG